MQHVLTETELTGIKSGESLSAFPESDSSSRSWSIPTSLSLEAAAYFGIVALAILSRFWNLGAKALHHDESLHAYYSWIYYRGDGYVHDPLMHGPFLFHANALIYFLFGDTDATSRYMPALFGVFLVALPYLLRGPRFLGRWGALAASFFLLISPSILYQSRYLRHDIYTITGTLLLFTCVVRYIDRPQRKWLVLGFGTVAFLLTNHEIVFAILAIFGAYVYGAVMIERFRAFRASDRRLALGLLLVHVVTVAALAILYLVVPHETRSELLAIPWENPTPAQERAYYRMVFTNPLVLGSLAIAAAFVVGLYLIFRKARQDSVSADTESQIAQPAERSSTAAVEAAWYDKLGLMWGIILALAIFVPLYTSLFQNMNGLATSTIATDGTLLYWLGQHDVHRGEQPWFYFLLLLPQYELIVVVLGVLFGILVTCRAVLSLFRPRCAPRQFFNLFIVVWFVFIFAGLSFAGEKMPWLVVHIALPGVLLAAAAVGRTIEVFVDERRKAIADDRTHFSLLMYGSLVGMMAILFFTFFWLAARMTYGQFIPEPSGAHDGLRRTITQASADQWWYLAIPGLVALLALALIAMRGGGNAAAFILIGSTVLILSLVQIHAGWRLSYYEADVPKDMLIYTQTSPDVVRVMNEIDELSAQLTGGDHLEVIYDSEVSWPFQWYLRNYDQKQFAGSSVGTNAQTAPVLLLGGGVGENEAALAGYTEQEYVLRWWFPEGTYRDFAIAPEIPVGRSAWSSSNQPHGPFDIARSVWESFTHQFYPDNQLRLYRLVTYRDLDYRLGQTRFRMYVRDDLIPLFNTIRY